MSRSIYKATVVFQIRNGAKVCIKKGYETLSLPQPIGIRFVDAITQGKPDGEHGHWEEHVKWFWLETKCLDYLVDIPHSTGKRQYNQPPIDKKTLKERIKKQDDLLKQLKKERHMESMQK